MPAKLETVQEVFKLREQMKVIKKKLAILEPEIKNETIPNVSITIGNYDVSVKKSERTILDTKRVKEDYKNLYDVYGKKQTVLTLKITEI